MKVNKSSVVIKRNLHQNRCCRWRGKKCVDYMDMDIGLFLEGTDLPICPACAIEQEPNLAKLMELAVTLTGVEGRINEAVVHRATVTLIKQMQ